MDEEKIIDAMALAICNAIRDGHDLPKLKRIADLADPSPYRKQARCALLAYRRVALGR